MMQTAMLKILVASALICSVVQGECGDEVPGYTASSVSITKYGCYDCPESSASGRPPEITSCTGAFDVLKVGEKSTEVDKDGLIVDCSSKCQYTCESTSGVAPCCAGMEGANCDIEIDACTYSPCHKDATCADLPGSAGPMADGRRCTCRPGFTEDGDACVLDPAKTNTHTLMQSDFTQGSYLISKPGRYVLGENILFNPNPRSAGGESMPLPAQLSTATPPGPYDARAFGLGFFAAIVVTATAVDIDLAGFKMEQAEEHALFQRFYAHIELSNVPFHYDQGPHNFTTTTKLESPSLVRVHNGYLGRASHHGIHGMAPSAVELSYLTITDFEVAGVSINGGTDLLIDQCVIGPGRRDVPVVGLWSTGIFIKPYVKQIIQSTEAGCGAGASITLKGEEVSGATILSELQKLQDDTYNYLIKGKGEEVPPLVTNFPKKNPGPNDNTVRNGLPDGSAMYGIVLANYGSHTNGLAPERNGTTCLDGNGEIVGMVDPLDTGEGWARCLQDGASTTSSGNERVVIKNTRIQGIAVQVNEVAAIKTKNWNSGQQNYDPVAQTDVVGAVYQYEANVDASFGAHGNWKGNAVSNAQLFVTKYLKMTEGTDTDPSEYVLKCFEEKPKLGAACPGAASSPGGVCKRNQKGGDPAQLQTELSVIRQETLDWAARGGLYTEQDGIMCGGDNMFHMNKGVFGIRLDAAENVKLQNVEIDTIENFAPPGSPMCGGDIYKSHPASIHNKIYMGGDAIGVSISGSKNVEFEHTALRHITSQNGNARGVTLFGDTDDVRGTVMVGKVGTNYLQGGSTAEPNFFKNRLPLQHHHAPPLASPLYVQEYACIPGTTMMDWMRMGGGVDGMAAMRAQAGDDDDILKPLVPGVDEITCSLVAQLEPVDGSAKLVFPVGSDVAVNQPGTGPSPPGTGPSPPGTGPSPPGTGTDASTDGGGGGASVGVFVAVLVIAIVVVAVAVVFGFKSSAGAAGAGAGGAANKYEANSIQMAPVDSSA